MRYIKLALLIYIFVALFRDFRKLSHVYPLEY